ncbi:hypothetical protein ABTX81_34860 [Kitasatospora sp. NPDC097605]|uniref:hypothetical protein n=1 Tax=Kitasatospora sp. NPDC097605 TaxID=3157226 RepID=UPI0033250DCF
MTRTTTLRLRVAAAALAATAGLLGAATSAQAAPAGAGGVAGVRSGGGVEVKETAQFTASSAGGSTETASTGAVNLAYLYAQGAGWQRSQCYVLAVDLRSTGGGWFSARATLFCQR